MLVYTFSSAAAAAERSLIVNEWSVCVKTDGKSLQSVTVRVNTALSAACIGEGKMKVIAKVSSYPSLLLSLYNVI